MHQKLSILSRPFTAKAVLRSQQESFWGCWCPLPPVFVTTIAQNKKKTKQTPGIRSSMLHASLVYYADA